MSVSVGVWELSPAGEGRDVHRFPHAELLSALQQSAFCGMINCAAWKLPSGCFCGHWCNQLGREQGFSNQRATDLSPLLPPHHWSPGADSGGWELDSPLRSFSIFCEPMFLLLCPQLSLYLAMGESYSVSVCLSDEKNYFFLSLGEMALSG